MIGPALNGRGRSRGGCKGCWGRRPILWLGCKIGDCAVCGGDMGKWLAPYGTPPPNVRPRPVGCDKIGGDIAYG